MSLALAAKAYEGVPFRHQGRSRAGLDCGGLLIVAAADVGRVLTDLKGYARQPDGRQLKALLDSQLTPIAIRDMQTDDVLLMRFSKHPQHVAIKTDTGLIHAYQDAGEVVEQGLDKKWRNRIVGAYRL